MKPVLYYHAVCHWGKNEFPENLEELAVEGTVIIHVYSSFTVKIKYLMML